MYQVSIVVPVYNAEKKLQRCIDSLLNQKNCAFELILVNDGSADKSGSICDKAAQTDERIRVIHQINKGAAAARNVGIKAAHGDYIAFCDADDTVSEHWLERMLWYAGENILPIGGYCNRLQDLGLKANCALKTQIQYPVSAYWEFQRQGLAGYLCNALYSREIIIENKLYIPERREINDINEDLTFALQYVPYMNGIVYTGYADYFYDTHEGSLSRSNRKMYFTKYEEKYIMWEGFIQKNCNKAAEEYRHLADLFLYHFLTALQEAYDDNDFGVFQKIVGSEAVKHCLSYADTSSENSIVVELLKRRKVIALWVFFKLVQIKKVIVQH